MAHHLKSCWRRRCWESKFDFHKHRGDSWWTHQSAEACVRKLGEVVLYFFLFQNRTCTRTPSYWSWKLPWKVTSEGPEARFTLLESTDPGLPAEESWGSSRGGGTIDAFSHVHPIFQQHQKHTHTRPCFSDLGELWPYQPASPWIVVYIVRKSSQRELDVSIWYHFKSYTISYRQHESGCCNDIERIWYKKQIHQRLEPEACKRASHQPFHLRLKVTMKQWLVPLNAHPLRDGIYVGQKWADCCDGSHFFPTSS